jgi:demethylmenaquinone methyltransferase/2-methoxy-6-polyprenyl-1,4-benzoquinol methylase
MMTLNLDPAAKMLYDMEPLRRPIIQTILSSLHLPDGSRGLDVGCGIGLQTLMMAQVAGRHGNITGLDTSTSFLEIAKMLARQTGLADCLSFEQGSWNQLPYKESTFDWVWSMDAAGYAPCDPLTTVLELYRVIKPGGRLMLGYWSSQCLLPGYPALEARLNASPVGITPFTMTAQPENHFLHTLGWMQEAGLVDTRALTFVQTISAPLGYDLRNALTELFEMRWGNAEPDVSPEDWCEYQRLCRATSPDFILNNSTYYAFFTYSVFSGMVPEERV